MDPHDKKSEEPDPKRQKLDIGDGEEKRDEMYGEGDEMSGEEECDAMSSSSSCGTYSTSSEESLGYTSEDTRLFDAEYKRSGDYDFDASKVGALVIYHHVVFENRDYATEPETDGELVERLSRAALKKYNDDEHTNLEFVRAVKANWNRGGRNIFSITLEAKDPSASHSEPIPFHAKHTNLEFVRAVKAYWNLGGGNIFSITLEAKDASASHCEPIPFHAKVRYLPGGARIYDVKPKP